MYWYLCFYEFKFMARSIVQGLTLGFAVDYNSKEITVLPFRQKQSISLLQAINSRSAQTTISDIKRNKGYIRKYNKRRKTLYQKAEEHYRYILKFISLQISNFLLRKRFYICANA